MGMKITQKHKKAALLCAQGYMSLKQIANEVGVARQTVIQWKQKPEFKALIMGYNEPLHCIVSLCASVRLVWVRVTGC